MLDIIEKDIKGIRLTISSTRTTIKFPLGTSEETKIKFQETSIKIRDSFIDINKTWRGSFNNNGSITMFIDSRKEKKYFPK